MTGKLNRRILPFALVLTALLVGSSRGAAAASGPASDISVGIRSSRLVVRPGQRVTYTVTTRNLGPDDASFVDITLQLPSAFRVTSVVCDGGVSPDGLACEYSSLPAGTTWVTQVTAVLRRMPPGGSRTVKIVAAAAFENADSFDPVLANNSASITTHLVGGR